MDIKLGMKKAITVVIGGGLAGLAAAGTLSRLGQMVILIESKGKIGGRATSFVDSASGDLIDNCQHVSMKCCTNLQYFCEEIGIGHYIKDEPSMFWRTPDGKTSLFKGVQLPAPLHFAKSFLGAHFLNWNEKIRLSLGMGLLRLTKEEEDAPFLEWLANHFQSQRCIERFWAPVLISALNTPMEKVGLHYARKVFVDVFWKNSKAYQLGLPVVPLSRLYGEEVITWLKKTGVEIRFGNAVKTVGLKSDSSWEVLLDNAEVINADNIVLAVPFQRVADLLGPIAHLDPAIGMLQGLRTAPITSVHLWFDRPITDLPHVVLLDSIGQWLFSRGKNEQGEYYYQVVISSSAELLKSGHDAVLKTVMAELPGFFADVAKAQLIRGRVVSEKQATFESSYGVDEFRPLQTTQIKGLYLAGDYTQTGWPATMEGAVRSGYLAAERILENEGKRVRCLQPDMR
jgi:squalene-associated FAD-dependent desaturase